MPGSQLILEKVDKQQYRFQYPSYVYDLDDLMFDAIDLLESENYAEAKDILHSIIDAFPEHIDARYHLAICLQEQGELRVAFAFLKKAVEIGINCLPKELSLNEIVLDWGWLENRPFLRAYEALGIEYYDKEDLSEAIKIFDNLLNLNPSDNQGVRALTIKCYFDLKQPAEVLKICDRYPGDALADTYYGRLLAQIQLENGNKIETNLQKAIKFLPMIAEELVKPYHSEFDELVDEFDDEKAEAMEYWEDYGSYWENTDGAIDYIKKGLLKYRVRNS